MKTWGLKRKGNSYDNNHYTFIAAVVYFDFGGQDGKMFGGEPGCLFTFYNEYVYKFSWNILMIFWIKIYLCVVPSRLLGNSDMASSS